MFVRRSVRNPIGFASVCLAGVLVIAACGASESTSGDRDRNIGGATLFASAIDGVARNRIGDASLFMPIHLTDRVQSDGFTLVGLTTIVMDEKGTRNEVALVRIGPDGGFDPSFGTDAVRRVVVKGDAFVHPVLGDDGRFIVPRTKIEDSSTQQLVGFSRYDSATGELDPTFGTRGTLDIPPVYVQDLDSLTVDNEGGVLIVGSESDTGGKWDLWRWTERGLDTTFGDGGRVDLAPPTEENPPTDWSFSCTRPTLSSKPDGRILAAYSCLKWQDVASDDGNQTTLYERLIAAREFSEGGVDINQQRIISLAVPNETAGGSGFFNILDIDFGMGSNEALTSITIETDGRQEVLTFADNMTSFNQPTDSGKRLGVEMPLYVQSPQNVSLLRLGSTRLVTGSTPHFVGIAANIAAGATTLEIGDLPLDNSPRIASDIIASTPITRLPSILHSYDRINYVGDDVFMNVPATGFAEFGDDQVELGTIDPLSGYLMVDRSGATRSPYGSADGIAPLPKREGADDLALVQIPGLFASRDGSLYTLSYRVIPPNPGGPPVRVMYKIGHYEADGEEIGTTNLELDGFMPFFSRQSLHAFDGVDSFYIGGFTPSGLGVAKLSLTDGGYDKNYGVNGFADFSSRDGDPGKYFFARLAIQSDGSLDAFATRWAFAQNDLGNIPLQISTVRFTPKGKIDVSKPEFTVTFPELAMCACSNDATSLQVARTAVVDAAGRLVVAMSGLRFLDEKGDVVMAPAAHRGDNGVRFAQVSQPEAQRPKTLGGGEVRRYTRDGQLDTTFGTGGTSSVSLYELGAEVPLGAPALAVGPEGNILVTTIGLEFDVPSDIDSEFDISVKGEYSYAILLNDAGSPINFTPQTPDPAIRRVADAINDSRGELGAGSTAAPQVASPAPAGAASSTAEQTVVAPVVAAPPGLSASIVVPPEVVQVNPTTRPIITVLGTPADRAVDVRWSVPDALAGSSASYTVTATPGGQKCTTSTTSCVFKKLEPWTTYTFAVTTVSALSTDAEVSSLIGIKPVRVLARDSRIDPTKLITPASTGKRTWRATGGCKVTNDGKLFTTPKDGALCTLSLTTAKVAKIPKTTRTITVVVRAVAK
jgi:hypothetical protein